MNIRIKANTHVLGGISIHYQPKNTSDASIWEGLKNSLRSWFS